MSEIEYIYLLFILFFEEQSLPTNQEYLLTEARLANHIIRSTNKFKSFLKNIHSLLGIDIA